MNKLIISIFAASFLGAISGCKNTIDISACAFSNTCTTVARVAGSQSTITGTSNILANGVATSTITITLKDNSGNVVAGETPTFSATDWESTNVYGACSVGDANGVSTCTLASSEGETKILSIITPVVKIDGSVVFNEVDYCTGNTANAPFAFGDGVTTPYGICTAAQLNNIGTNAAYINKSFKLFSNLDLASYTANSFALIATAASPFTGTFNGNRKVISNLTFSNSTAVGDSLGLFRKIGSTGIVKNLGLTGFSITGRSIVGALAGESVGIVDNCYAKGAVSGADRVGGLLGRFWETSAATYVLNSYAEVNVTGTGFVGGLIGWVRGTVTGTHAIGTITAGGGSRVGGLVGTVDQGTIINSYAEGSVTGNQLVGGLIGTIGGSISGSHAISTVTCGSYCGGITGNIGSGSGSGKLEKSYSIVTLNSTSYVIGGVVGYGYANYNIENCYSTVTINSNSNYLGGVTGWTGGTITNSYAIPLHVGNSGVAERGGITGEDGGVITGSFWNNELDTSITVTEGASANTAGSSTTAVMKTAQTYIDAGWSSTIWNIQDGSYPTLK
jgi:hypothetical protein